MFNRQTLTIAGVIVIIGVLLLIGIFSRQANPEQPEVPKPLNGSSAPQQSSSEEENHDEIFDDLFVDNFTLVEQAFPEDKYIFVNNRIREYAQSQNPDTVAGLKLDDTTFVKRDDRSYGFSITNAAGEHQFYVIASHLPDGQVKVDIYES